MVTIKQEYNCKNYPKISLIVFLLVATILLLTLKTEELAEAIKLLKHFFHSKALTNHAEFKVLVNVIIVIEVLCTIAEHYMQVYFIYHSQSCIQLYNKTLKSNIHLVNTWSKAKFGLSGK